MLYKVLSEENIFRLDVRIKLRELDYSIIANIEHISGNDFIIFFNTKLIDVIRDEEYLRAIVRHELCHALDVLDLIYETYFRITHIAQIDWYIGWVYMAYTDFVAGKRFLSIYGTDSYNMLKEIALSRIRDIMNKHEVCYIDRFFRVLKYLMMCMVNEDVFISFSTYNKELIYQIYSDFVYISKKESWFEKLDDLKLETIAILMMLSNDEERATKFSLIRDLLWCNSDLYYVWFKRMVSSNNE